MESSLESASLLNFNSGETEVSVNAIDSEV